MLTLSGRTCVFAGASGGDGVAGVRALLSQGMNVVMMTHMMKQAAKLKEELDKEGYPGKVAIYCDPKTYDPPKTEEEVYEAIYNEFGSIDVIISNIGGPGHEDSIDSLSKEELLRNVNHLVGGGYEMLKYSLPYLRKSSNPRVIFMTSFEAVKGGTLDSLSNSIAKGAVYSMMKNVAARLMKEGITVNCIVKGAIERRPDKGPGMPGMPKPKDPAEMLPFIPAGRLAKDTDLAQAICYLASEEAAYVTGTALDISGGLSLT
ncbi:MAG: SDR family NAD(P)-dependent oxidoreductase [Lachnospiraceae bacterium]|jgi:NAD(P)-dependent dehydrogenase (short-subunit alcohol dehydrogenase family)